MDGFRLIRSIDCVLIICILNSDGNKRVHFSKNNIEREYIKEREQFFKKILIVDMVIIISKISK